MRITNLIGVDVVDITKRFLPLDGVLVYFQPIPKRLPVRIGMLNDYDFEKDEYEVETRDGLAVKAIDGTYNIPAEELHVVGDNR